MHDGMMHVRAQTYIITYSASRRQYLQEIRLAGAPRPGEELHCLLRHGRRLRLREAPAAGRTPPWLLSATDGRLLRIDWSDLFLFQHAAIGDDNQPRAC